MRRTTISLPIAVAAILEREARRRRVPVSKFASEGIEASLGLRDEEQPWILQLVGLWETDGSYPTARDLDEFLEEHFAADIEADAFAGSR